MLSTIYALLCIIVPCSLYQLIICKRQNKKQENKAIHFAWVYIFLLYIYLTFSVAGIGSIWDIGHYDTIIRLEEINLLPTPLLLLLSVRLAVVNRSATIFWCIIRCCLGDNLLYCRRFTKAKRISK